MGADQQMAAADTPDQGQPPSGGTIMHRKAEAGRAVHKARAMSLAKALRLTCAKVADRLFDLPLAAIAIRSETVQAEDLTDQFAPGHLLMLLDGPMQGRGGAAMGPELVAALIQQQTMGKVLKPAGEGGRPLTATDSALCAPFLDALLAQAAPLPEDPADQRLLTGYAFGAWVETPRVLAIALDAPDFEVIRITIDIANGVSQGELLFCLPLRPAEESLPVEDEKDTAKAVDAVDPARTLCETVQNLRADLRIGLTSLRLPLRELGRLAPGSVLDIGCPDFSRVSVQTATGKAISRGALGQLDGVRAVQVAHTHRGLSEPRRRASDRDGLGLPDIGAAPDRPEALPGAEALPALPGAEGDWGAPPDGALTQDSASELPDLPELPDLDDLPELPDMSDLPELEDLPKFSVG